MKRFLLKTTLFLGMGFLYMLAMYQWNSTVAADLNPVPEAASREILIAGDSQTLRGINPDLLPHAFTMAQTAEPLFATYWKLERLLPLMPGVRVLMVSFGTHSFSAFHTLRLADPVKAQKLFERIYPLARLEELDGVRIDWRTCYRTIVRRMCLYPTRKHTDYISAYENNRRPFVDNARASIRRHYFNQGKLCGVEQKLIGYMDRIIALCRSRGIRVVLVSPPVHEGYRRLVPELFLETYRKESARFRAMGITVLDYRAAPFSNEEFRDSNHLNARGSKRFTGIIAAELGL